MLPPTDRPAIVIPAHGGNDPDGINQNRVAWGGAMIAAIMAATRTDHATALCDGLADLMHWANENDFCFADELGRACNHFHAETGSGDETDEAPPTIAQHKLSAIRARVNGVFDHPSLLHYGPMSGNTNTDLMVILNT